MRATKLLKRIVPGALALLLVLAAGCTAAPAPNPLPAQTQKPGVQEPDAQDPGAPALAQPLRMPALNAARPLPAPNFDKESAGAGAGANEFAFRLSAALAKQGENMILSPFSVWMTLAALSNATGQDALPQLLKSLNLEGLSVEDINASAALMLYTLTNGEGKDTHNPLSIANAVFVDDHYTLQQDFAQKFLDYYRGTAMNVNFNDPSAMDAINQWASEHTNGLIDDIVKEIPRDTVAAIANAIYFSDRWGLEFDPAQTQDMTFYGVRSEAKMPFMLREGDGLPYYEDDKLQAITLPFRTGGAMTILLPKDGGADTLLASMNAARFEQILADMQGHTGKLLLPRFEISSDYELSDALIGLGVPLFDSDALPITGLIEGERTYISSGLHQANIKVDEKGTTAAAVTVQMISRSSLPLPTQPFSMVADHPFLFVLHQWTGDAGAQVLFTGIVDQLG